MSLISGHNLPGVRDKFGFPCAPVLPENFAKVYLKMIDDELEPLKLCVLQGRAKDHAEYKWITGQIVALEASREKFVDLLNQANQHYDR